MFSNLICSFLWENKLTGMVEKERFSQDLFDKMRKNIELRAKNEGFGSLKLISNLFEDCLYVSFGGLSARAAFFSGSTGFRALSLF